MENVVKDRNREGNRDDESRPNTWSGSAKKFLGTPNSWFGSDPGRSSSASAVSGQVPGRSSVVGQNDVTASRRSSSAPGSEVTRDRRYNHRYHNRDVFDPPGPCGGYCVYLKQAICKSIADACTFWRRLRDDRFHWELFKSVLWFTIGLKLFNDITRHINNARQKPRCRPRR
ncbi:unnamed protein product [Spodoptera exigua]|nr:unnamed protein product [Spodoptera exigua]